ncbi:acetyl/propionyl/methylcrotonyl-CoA carboxylase subunit alpha [Fodinicola acaciae]|uniref:acetyl/propionyl/methylcrotonyl-CoA carboxylase subunit alpha n=1 Tax=Fodinicola acaciae TaxID=2681555 RepID=UPI0013D44E46|nr:biotin carboxylase N-terminal domain-containing protein [Fodinicola acaciae]
MPITTVLVANRGEIARRVFHTCSSLGVATVAVFSDADAGSPHVREADTAVQLAGNAATDTYLHVDALIAAAKQSGADAVHPGYGFLSENAAFARAVEDAGLVWIGPPAAAIDAMGSKIASKELMAKAGVPVLDRLDPADVRPADLPVLIKASAGGGGRGMRIVRDLTDLPAELTAAAAEAASAFGDGSVFCERYLPTGRHIEVQVMADAHGTVWAMQERECSIQRRHQKIIEETPSPLVSTVPRMREKLLEAAVAAARAIDYRGAGTVEFLATDDGEFFFLEMNTRLQVEHPVTECVHGVDLVRAQLRIANGEPLGEMPPASGHAIEARLYAEDPSADWQPQTGALHRFGLARPAAQFELWRHGLRLDSGVESGSEVGIFYDPMLAKVIAYQPARADAATALAGVLRKATIHGVGTNRDLLVRVLTSPDFLAGQTRTDFLDRHPEVFQPLLEGEEARLAALAAALADAAANRRDPETPIGWRNVVSAPIEKKYDDFVVSYQMTRDGLAAAGYPDVELVEATSDAAVLTVGGLRRHFAVARYGDLRCVDSAAGSAQLHRIGRFATPGAEAVAGSLTAPMPGSIVRLAAAAGDRVRAGQPLLWLEAMKMEHQVNAPVDGVLEQLSVHVGQQVDIGAVLAVVRAEESGS